MAERCKLEFYRNVSGGKGEREISVVNQGSPLGWIYRLVPPNLVRNRGRRNLVRNRRRGNLVRNRGHQIWSETGGAKIWSETGGAKIWSETGDAEI